MNLRTRKGQIQREMANKRMMSNVPEADVVITNPTHYSLALRYDPETMETPILVAKGIDHVAFKIRDIAREHKIEIVRSPVLARSIYHHTQIDESIPQGLYVAVAQVLAYVFQLRNFRKGFQKICKNRNSSCDKPLVKVIRQIFVAEYSWLYPCCLI